MDKRNKDIDNLIIACLSNNMTETEKEHFDRWIKKSPENHEQFELIKKVWQERSQDRKLLNSNEILERIWKERHHADHEPRQVKTFDIGFFLKIAAALLILFAAMYLLIEHTNHSVDIFVAESNLIIKGNPAGQKSRITLSDGSIIWLNASSSVSYLEKFSHDERKITLIGEAYFEVAPDFARPFVVTTGQISTTALGTTFNINAFDAGNIKIALITGNIKVVNESHQNQPYFLNPGMGLVLSGNEEVHGYSFDMEKIALWRNGVLVFDGENFIEFKKIIERWYGITVKVDGRIPGNWSIKGQFENETLENVMKSISFNKKFDYEIKGKTLTIKI